MKKNLIVELIKDDEEQIEKIICDINALREQASPPSFCEERICAKCAYHDLCFI